MDQKTSSHKHDIPKRESLGIISLFLAVLWAIILVVRSKLFGLSDGSGFSEFSLALLLPFVVLGAGLASCISGRCLLLTWGAIILFGIILIALNCIRSGGISVLLTILASGYGLFWWNMYLERKKEKPTK